MTANATANGAVELTLKAGHGELKSPTSAMFRTPAAKHRSSGRRTRQKLTPSSEGLGFGSGCAPGFRTQLHVTTSLSTGGGPVTYVQLSERGFQVVYPLSLWSRFSGVVKVLYGYG